MEQKVNVWKATLKYGAILGMISIIVSLLRYYSVFFNGNVYCVFVVYFLQLYRDNYCFGKITYWQSVGAGVIIYLYCVIIKAIFMFFIFEIIGAEFIDVEFLKPNIYTLVNLTNATIILLVASIFIKKKLRVSL